MKVREKCEVCDNSGKVMAIITLEYHQTIRKMITKKLRKVIKFGASIIDEMPQWWKALMFYGFMLNVLNGLIKIIIGEFK